MIVKDIAASVQGGPWRTRIVTFLVLAVPLYIVPTSLKLVLVGSSFWYLGVLMLDIISSLAAGFIVNNYWFGTALYLISTCIEGVFIAATHKTALVSTVGDLIPALICIYFAQLVFVNTGD